MKTEKYNVDPVISDDSSAQLPDGEHRPAVDEAPAGDNKDTADEKMDGKGKKKQL